MKTFLKRNGRVAAILFMISYSSLLLAAAPVSQSAFEKTIANIEKWVVDLTADAALFGSKEFINIYEHSTTYYGNVIVLLGKPGINDRQKVIAVFAMQRLPRKEYLLFLNVLLDLLEKDKINFFVYEAGPFPGFDWNTTLPENYKDPDIIAYLNKAKASSKLSQERKAYIGKILSGQAAQDVEDWRDMQQINPAFKEYFQK
ncbi:MAG: hypothetical protein HY922_01050 [Elusimicrobia bacterium]|nr:hypothetical protein [Elusimicrobiota bacterium]